MGRLKSSDKAIHFTTQDYTGNQVDLNDYTGQRILLSFFRGPACPFCNMRVHQLIKNYPKFKKRGIVILALFAAPKEEIAKYAGSQKAPFHIIADPGMELYKKYGVEQSSFGMIRAMLKPVKMLRMMTSGFFNLKSLADRPIVPADFLIDQDRIINRAYYGKDFGDHIPIREILEWKEYF